MKLSYSFWIFLILVLVAQSASPALAQSHGASLFGLPALSRADFNRLAAREGFLLFWVTDDRNPGTFDPDELAVLGVAPDRAEWVKDGAFTPRFESAYRQLVEVRRQEAVALELDQGLPTLLSADLTALSPAEKEFVRRISDVADLVDRLHGRQVGADAFSAAVASGPSRTLFYRNNGPWCEAAKTESDPFCNAVPDFPARKWGAYPEDEIHDEALCKRLAEHPDRKALLDPFTVVRKEGGEYRAVPLNVAYEKEMREIADALRAAAKTLKGANEAAMEKYLLAAAQGFETNDWSGADEAWAAMNSRNSKWYLRVGPDEVGWDLCQEKAGFHVSFGRIDRGSLDLQDKLMPLRIEMETSLASLIGKPYTARKVAFHMPDFLQVIINAGESRSPLGGTLGQSLPNWGKVAEEGRGRTVVMTNLYQDADSRRIGRARAEAMLGPATMALYGDEPRIGLIDVLLHEATHNLGPHSDYKVDGKGPTAIFGGPLAGTLEELKAQTGALYFTELLRKKSVITDAEAKKLYVHALVWSFGHLSQGLFRADGNPKPYSQLSAVQVGFLSEEGALSWEVAPDPQTGKPTGRFEVQFDRFPAAVEKLMQAVGRAKATGDVAAARALVERYTTGEKKDLVHLDEIIARLRGFPKATFRYEIRL